MDEGFSFLAATDGALQAVSHPTPPAVAFENVWQEVAAEAGPEMTELATTNLGQVLSTSSVSSILDGDVSVSDMASFADLEAESALGDGIGTALSGSVIIALESLVQWEDDSVAVQLSNNVNAAKATVDLGTDATNATDQAVMLQTFVDLTMPSFTLTRADDQAADSPAQQGPTVASDPAFCVGQSQCQPSTPSLSSTFSYVDWQGQTQTASVSKGWFVQGPIPGSYPFPYEYVPSLQVEEGPTTQGQSPTDTTGDQEWTAWLDGPSASSPGRYQFLMERNAVNAGPGYVSDYLNGCPNYNQSQGGNVDNGNECVTPQQNEVGPVTAPNTYPTFAMNFQKGDSVSIGGQVRQVSQVWDNSSGNTYAFVTSAPFDTDGTNLGSDPIELLTTPDPQNCTSLSSLGSRVLGPDCVLTDAPQILTNHYASTETVGLTPQGQGKANPELAISAPSTTTSGTAFNVTITSVLGASDPKIDVSDGTSSCKIAVSGTCNFTETAGTTITATFSGDSNYFADSAQTFVNGTVDPSTTSLSTNGITAGTYGQQVNLVATVALDAPCAGAPSTSSTTVTRSPPRASSPYRVRSSTLVVLM